ncbi:hypothetical protein AaE_000143 [Aphanomyces astaci]|uniref:Uncharacterized protein n=1 Tax=Aphanomyces astaci TaxID=112090 RepID=A0A6A5AWM2_APHAT|nr:hypothetical protein AaE_000143 [Aphanomyces astaci]
MPPKHGKAVPSRKAAKFAWTGSSVDVLNGETYYDSICMTTTTETRNVCQFDVVHVRVGSTTKLATIHTFWEDASGTMMMEVRYMMALATLPPSLKRKLMQSTFTDTTTTSDKEVVVDTTAIDELAVACLVNVVDLAASYICTKLYAPLTGTLTSITTDNDAQTMGYVYRMGKTATVKEILRTLERERDAQAIPPFTWIEVNGLHMPKPDQACVLCFRVKYFIVL